MMASTLRLGSSLGFIFGVLEHGSSTKSRLRTRRLRELTNRVWNRTHTSTAGSYRAQRG